MLSLFSYFITAILSFNVPSRTIHTNIHNEYINKTKTYLERPNDPTLSCYLLENGLWKCVSDMDTDVDNDDSY